MSIALTALRAILGYDSPFSCTGSMKPHHLYRFRLALFAALYIAISSAFVIANKRWPIGEAFWPYTGIGLAGILLFGFRIWPLIIGLNFLLQLTHYGPGIAAMQ